MLLRRFCLSCSTTYGDGGVTNLSWTGRSVVTSGTRYLTNRSPEGAMVIETAEPVRELQGVLRREIWLEAEA